MNKRAILIFSLIFFIFAFTGCTRSEYSLISRDNFMLDTHISISIYDWNDEDTITLAMNEISRLENLLSVHRKNSDLDQLRQSAGVDWIPISTECQEILLQSKEYYKMSNGYFDVTTGPLIELWNIRKESEGRKGHYPTEAELTQAISLISSEKLLVEEGRAYLEEKGMVVNLGAIAKGYIADKVKELLVLQGVEHAIINLGGNVLLIGGKPNGDDFSIGVRSPFDSSKIITTLKLTDKSAVTSGVYERYFEYEGTSYHHILDPFSGYPSNNGVISVTIISDVSTVGDALSTTCLLLGVEKGLPLIEKLPGIEALFILEDRQEIRSSGFSIYEN